jgi:hypothetical protein
MKAIKNSLSLILAAGALVAVHGVAMADYVSPEPQYTGGTPALRADVARQAVEAQRQAPLFAQGEGVSTLAHDRAASLRLAASEPMAPAETAWLLTVGEPSYASFAGTYTPAQDVRVARRGR